MPINCPERYKETCIKYYSKYMITSAARMTKTTENKRDGYITYQRGDANFDTWILQNR